MQKPYASVILPTLNRSSTLPWSLASVQRQTQTSLEIFIVLDGASPACREIALTAAHADPRVHVLDLPKAPGTAGQNIHLAISQTSSERIFYIDDDDLWLPDHIERLGLILNDADIADSRVCSVDRSGGLNLGPCSGSNDRIRALLGAHRLKMLYDTHVAHRRDAYGKFSQWRSDGETGVPVSDFLAGFARHTECRWKSSDAVTALSLHGAARRDMEPQARTAEIMRWYSLLGDNVGLMSRADSTFHLFRLLILDPPQGDTFEKYLSIRGGYSDGPIFGLDNDLFELFTGKAVPEANAVAVAVKLSEPVEAGPLFENIALLYFQVYGQDEHERILSKVAAAEGDNRGARLAAYSVAVSRRDIALALNIAERAVAARGPDSIGAIAGWHAALARRALG